MKRIKGYVWLVLLAFTTAFLPLHSIATASAGCTPNAAEAQTALDAMARLTRAGMIIPIGMEAGGPTQFGVMTRREAAAVLSWALGTSALPPVAHAPFLDMTDLNQPETLFVAHLKQERIVAGFPDGTFRPQGTLTLQQLELMLARMLRLGNNLTLEKADNALRRGGVNTTIPCTSATDAVTENWGFILVDRALSVPMYARFATGPNES